MNKLIYILNAVLLFIIYPLILFIFEKYPYLSDTNNFLQLIIGSIIYYIIVIIPLNYIFNKFNKNKESLKK